jgi:hypothetical protein
MSDLFILNGGKRLVGQTKREAKEPDPSGAASHETGNNQIYHILCPPTADVLLDLIKVLSVNLAHSVYAGNGRNHNGS